MWAPLFRGDAALPYERAIADIAAAIANHAQDDHDWGATLLHAYLARCGGGPAEQARADELLDRLIEGAAGEFVSPTLHGGFVGVGWTCAHLDDRATDGDEVYGSIDELLLQMLRDGKQYSYDLIHGLVGLGVYFLERLPADTAREGLARVVERLATASEAAPGGIAWRTQPHLIAEADRPSAPLGRFDLGVAHGVPGVIGLLAEVHRTGIETARTASLLIHASRWLIAQQLPGGGLPALLVPGQPARPARLAWCYGELGASSCLLLAARALDDDAIERAALELALHAARRTTDDGSWVNDAGLCHGAAGVAHVFHRLFRASGRPELRDAAAFWFERALQMRVDGAGVAGYQSFVQLPGAPARWDDDASFLTGATGIALAFLAATSATEPAWDRALLCSVAPRASGRPPP